MGTIPNTHIAEAIEILGSVLDVPKFPPDQPLPISLVPIRSLAFESLLGLAGISSNALFEEDSQMRTALLIAI